MHPNDYSAIKKNEIMPFSATWMDLEIIILSEVRERQISYDITYTNELIYKTEIHSQTKNPPNLWLPKGIEGVGSRER